MAVSGQYGDDEAPIGARCFFCASLVSNTPGDATYWDGVTSPPAAVFGNRLWFHPRCAAMLGRRLQVDAKAIVIDWDDRTIDDAPRSSEASKTGSS